MSLLSFLGFAKSPSKSASPNFYELSFKDIDGKERSMSEFRGKVLLIVNTASQCGFTGQYEGLEKIYDKYKEKGLVVLGFPSNDFGGQEPGSEKEIKFFCEEKYEVSFPLFSKSSVKGDKINPVFQFLTEKAGGRVMWNFEKFLINRQGEFVERWRSITGPESKGLVKAVEAELNKNF